MISTIELYRAIRERLEASFPDIQVQQKDVKNIERPSFYIQYLGKSFTKQAQTVYEDRISYNIIYFSQNEELLELLEVEETIVRIFSIPLSIVDDGCIVEIEKDGPLQSNLNEEDYFLNITIDFVLSQSSVEEELGETVENIELTVNTEDVLTTYTDEVEDQEEDETQDDEVMNDLDINLEE